jgi:hypothetical protein
LLPPGCNLSDARIEALRDSLYCLAAVAVDMAAEQNAAKKEPLSPAGIRPTNPVLLCPENGGKSTS